MSARTQTEKKIPTPGPSSASATGVLLAALPTLVPRLTIALSCQSPHRQSRPCRRVDHLVFHMTVNQRQKVLSTPMYTSLANMSCSAAFLAWVGLAVISFTTQFSVEFVNNLVAVLNVLASQVATALDTLNFALATERNPAVRHPSVSQSSTEFQAWTAPSHHHRAHLVRSVSHSCSDPNPACGYFLHLVYTCTIPASCGTSGCR